jgi:adenylate cyclase
VIRRISDFNSEFGLDIEQVASSTGPRAPSDPGFKPEPAVTREKIFQVLVQVAKALLSSEELGAVLNTVMDIIFKYLPVERGLIILFDDDGNPVPKLTKFIEGSDGGGDIPISRTILKMVAEQQIALMTSNALEDARLLGGKSIAIHGIRSAMCVPLWNRQRVIGAVQVDSPIHIGRFTEEDLDLLTALANFAAVAIERAQMAEKIEQERKIRSKMERYHSPAVIDEIVKGVITTDETEIRNAELSILFADISGFTTVSETQKPEEVAEFLSHFFSCAVESIFAYGGTLDKFIGDAVMAFFGAPIPQEDHADRAVLAGLMMQRLVGDWNAERAKTNLAPVFIRVGINSGPAVVGNVGTEKRVDYTVLGSAVNIASRLESGVAKPGQVVISKNTLERIIGSFQMEPLGEFALKGLQQKMPVYSVTGSSGVSLLAVADAAPTRTGSGTFAGR